MGSTLGVDQQISLESVNLPQTLATLNCLIIFARLYSCCHTSDCFCPHEVPLT